MFYKSSGNVTNNNILKYYVNGTTKKLDVYSVGTQRLDVTKDIAVSLKFSGKIINLLILWYAYAEGRLFTYIIIM